MADGVGGGQSALQVSTPLRQLEATVLSLASSRTMPMLDKQDGRVGHQCIGLLGSLEWAVQAEGCSMHPMVLHILSILYPVVQSQGQVSMLNESVADIGDADCKVALKMQCRFFQWIGSQDGSWPTSFLPDEFKSFRIADFNVNFYTTPMCRELPKDREQVENHFCFDRCIETWLSLEELISYVQ